MIKLVENFREFLDLAKINQGPDGWTIYGANPKKKNKSKKKINRRLRQDNQSQKKA